MCVCVCVCGASACVRLCVCACVCVLCAGRRKTSVEFRIIAATIPHQTKVRWSSFSENNEQVLDVRELSRYDIQKATKTQLDQSTVPKTTGEDGGDIQTADQDILGK